MEQIYDFLKQLAANNNREWFNANKAHYLEVQAKFNKFAEELIEAISQWDEDIAASNLTVKDCTYRIYRDTRFSKNKAPYKTHMGVFICKGGKKAPYAGYYFHIEPHLTLPDSTPNPTQKENTDNDKRETISQQENGLKCEENRISSDNLLSLGGCVLLAGTYRFENKVLRSIRDEISVNGESFLDSIREADGFKQMEGGSLKKVPAEFAFAPENVHHLLKQKEFILGKFIDEEYLYADNLTERISEDFKKSANFIHKINMAVDYAIEEIQ